MDGFEVVPPIGFEHVWHYSFDPTVERNNFLGVLSLKWFPEERLRK